MSSEQEETNNETAWCLPIEFADPSSSSSSTEHGIPTLPQHLQQEAMNQVLLLPVTARHDDDPPPQSTAMNIDNKRPASIGADVDQDHVPPEAKRIKIDEDAIVPAPSPLAEYEVAFANEAKHRRTAAEGQTSATPTTIDVAGKATIEPAAHFNEGILSAPAALQEQASTTLVPPKDTCRAPTVNVSSFSSSSLSSSEGLLRPVAAAPPSAASPPPLKSTQMVHLHSKYYVELEYMLREFRKLERQLLGAKGNGTGIEESSGSRERREKLHSFILHLDDTIRQIEVGCRLEAEGKSTTATTGEEERQQAADSAALTTLTKEKEDEENVQKLEEHILANLLPVKVRLKKQLAAQQGATRNPIGMPAAPRGLQPSTAAEKGKGTFVAAAEERRKQAEAARAAFEEQAFAAPTTPSQFGKPLSGGGSSLTQKLHGSTLGSQKRTHGHGVGSAEAPIPDPTASDMEANDEDAPKRKILYGGMAPGSEQHQSGVSAAAGIQMITIEIKGPEPAIEHNRPKSPATHAAVSPPKADHHPSLVPPKDNKPDEDPTLTEEERTKFQKDRRRRKKHRELERREKERQRQLFLQQQAVQASATPKGPIKKVGKGGVKMGPGKKKGPRTVEYICALCSEAYSSICDYNPWWALASHECPKCRKMQVPRIDITSPLNAIEYHPALLAHAEEGPAGASGMGSAPPPSVMHHIPAHPAYHPMGPPGSKFPAMYPLSDSDEESDLSELSDAANLSEDSYDSDDSEGDMPLSEGELAELEGFGKDYEGPKLTPDESSRLLILMGHAQTCPGRHKSVKHRDCCNSVKYMMLHVRDCPGTTSTFDVCPFPWCRKIKHLMYHLVACPRPRDCAICSPIALSPNIRAVIGLNSHRRKKHRERMKAVMAAAAAAAKAKPPAPKIAYVPKGAKPVAYRPPVKKTTGTNKPYKSAVAKPVHPGPPRVVPIVRTGAKPVPGRAPTLLKPTNGVVVKSLFKPAGRSVVILKARPQRPVLTGAKPTVAALPGAKPTVAALPCVVDPASKEKCVPSLVVSCITTVATPTMPAPIPTPVKPYAALQGTQLARTGQPTSLVAVSTQPQSSAGVVKVRAAAQSALAVNAPEQAAKAAMEDKAPMGTQSTPHDIAGSLAAATVVVKASSVPAAVNVNPQAVAFAAAVAASMSSNDAITITVAARPIDVTEGDEQAESAASVTSKTTAAFAASVSSNDAITIAVTERSTAVAEGDGQTAASVTMNDAIALAEPSTAATEGDEQAASATSGTTNDATTAPELSIASANTVLEPSTAMTEADEQAASVASALGSSTDVRKGDKQAASAASITTNDANKVPESPADVRKGDEQAASATSITTNDAKVLESPADVRKGDEQAESAGTGPTALKDQPKSANIAPVPILVPVQVPPPDSTSQVVTPPTSSTAEKPANPTPLTIEPPQPDASQALKPEKPNASEGVGGIASNIPATNSSLTPLAKPGPLQEKQELTLPLPPKSSSNGDLTRQSPQERPFPPRFPEVPVVVAQEATEEKKTEETPQEVPPV